MQPRRFDPIPTVPAPKHPLANPTDRVSFVVSNTLSPPPKTGIDWSHVLDATLFVSLLVIGAGLLYFREELKVGAVVVVLSFVLTAANSFSRLVKSLSTLVSHPSFCVVGLSCLVRRSFEDRIS